jgi:hypothetical protein
MTASHRLVWCVWGYVHKQRRQSHAGAVSHTWNAQGGGQEPGPSASRMPARGPPRVKKERVTAGCGGGGVCMRACRCWVGHDNC